MTDRQLDTAIAEKVMGLCIHKWNKRIIPNCIKCGGYYMKVEHTMKPLPYSTERNAAALVLERIRKSGLRDSHLDALWRIINPEVDPEKRTWGDVTRMLTATPRQLMEAALVAVASSREPGADAVPFQGGREMTAMCEFCGQNIKIYHNEIAKASVFVWHSHPTLEACKGSQRVLRLAPETAPASAELNSAGQPAQKDQIKENL